MQSLKKEKRMGDPHSLLTRSVVLVGPMGAGKTTVGARLAERLGVPFADSDAEIERAVGLSIAEIFETRGEQAFRTVERQTVARLTGKASLVVAVGGGAFADEDSRRQMLERCSVVWLDADVPTLAARLTGDRDRPLLRGEDPQAALARLAAQRNSRYAEAHVRVDARGAIDQVVEQVVKALAGRR
jgi:shikimate kinase